MSGPSHDTPGGVRAPSCAPNGSGGSNCTGLLPSGVQYATDSKLHDHEFDKVDFYSVP